MMGENSFLFTVCRLQEEGFGAFAGMTYSRALKERTMQAKTLKSDLLLLTAAFIWGTTFVAPRMKRNDK